MIKAVLILGLAAIASAQVLRISPVVIGQTSPGQQQVIHLSGGGGLGSAPQYAARPAAYQAQPQSHHQAQPVHHQAHQVHNVQVRPIAVAAQPVAVTYTQPAPAVHTVAVAQPSFVHQAAPVQAYSQRAPAQAARYESEERVQFHPYAFGFESEDEYQTKIARSESASEQGVVTGSYSINDANGIARVVEYVADENGFRATVRTNEPGTLTSQPADVKIESSSAPARR